MKDRPNLDILRSIAVLLVVFDHTALVQGRWQIGAWPAWAGVFGVYLFFVHTCTVLMWSLERKPHTLDFYIRRAFRIYPLAMVCVLAVVLLRLPLAAHGNANLFVRYAGGARGVMTNLLLVQNIFKGGGYVTGVLWSLPLEVDMYVLLPVLFFFVRRNFSVWPLLVLWVLAAALGRESLAQGNVFATVVPCFLPGVMAYVLFARVRPRVPAWMFPLFVGVLAVLFLRASAVWAAWPVCLALGLGMAFFRQSTSGAMNRVTHKVAKYSYGLYLFHMFGLLVGFHVLRGQAFGVQLAVALVVMVALAVLGYHAMERPMIELGARLAAVAEERYEQRVL
jgi:peptidoglycan/LPS O-acetylase OafA/YrhL